MKYVEVTGASLAALLRGLVVRREWLDVADVDPTPLAQNLLGDWVLVLCLFWAAVAGFRDRPRARTAALLAACAWLAVIYACHQGEYTFRLIRPAPDPLT